MKNDLAFLIQQLSDHNKLIIEIKTELQKASDIAMNTQDSLKHLIKDVNGHNINIVSLQAELNKDNEYLSKLDSRISKLEKEVDKQGDKWEEVENKKKIYNSLFNNTGLKTVTQHVIPLVLSGIISFSITGLFIHHEGDKANSEIVSKVISDQLKD